MRPQGVNHTVSVSTAACPPHPPLPLRIETRSQNVERGKPQNQNLIRTQSAVPSAEDGRNPHQKAGKHQLNTHQQSVPVAL